MDLIFIKISKRASLGFDIAYVFVILLARPFLPETVGVTVEYYSTFLTVIECFHSFTGRKLSAAVSKYHREQSLECFLTKNGFKPSEYLKYALLILMLKQEHEH